MAWSLLVITPRLSSSFDENSDEYEINIVLQYCNSNVHNEQTLSFSLTYAKNTPKLVQFQDVMDDIPDLIVQWLEDLEGHRPDYPAIINNLVWSCLRLLECNTNNTADYSQGIYLVEQLGDVTEEKEDDPKKVIKRLLVVTGNIINVLPTKDNAYVVPSCCTICLDDIDMHHDHNHHDDHDHHDDHHDGDDDDHDGDDDDDHDGDGDVFEMVKLGCTHVYHVDCMVEWILKSGVDVSCPMCRIPLFEKAPDLLFDDDDDDKVLVNGSSTTLQITPQEISQSSSSIVPRFISQCIEFFVCLFG